MRKNNANKGQCKKDQQCSNSKKILYSLILNKTCAKFQIILFVKILPSASFTEVYIFIHAQKFILAKVSASKAGCEVRVRNLRNANHLRMKFDLFSKKYESFFPWFHCNLQIYCIWVTEYTISSNLPPSKIQSFGPRAHP